MAYNSYNWHIWHTDPKTKKRTYKGAVQDTDAGIAWKKKQDFPEQYTVTNFGPLAEGKPRPLLPKEMDQARKGISDADMLAVVATPKGRPVTKKTVAASQPETAEQKALKADAKGLLEGHKKDEAADLKAGRNK